MATVNRYTQTKDSIYQPQTLQELMVAPAYKRKQHDELDSSIAEYETLLSQYDALDYHSDALNSEQKNLYDKMRTQRDKLNQEGFSKSSKSDFFRFNKEFQGAIGPQGNIGKISQAKKDYEANMNEYITNATAMGYSPDQAKKNWEDHEVKYKQVYNETGKISSIGRMYAPKYRDAVAEFKTLLKDANYSMTSLNEDLGTGYIKQDPSGSYVLTTKGFEKYKNNHSQIQGALNYISDQINTVGTEVYNSLIHQGKTPELAMKEIEGLEQVYLSSEIQTGSGAAITNFTPTQATKIEKMNNSGLTYVGSSFDLVDMEKDYKGVNSEIERLNQLKLKEGRLSEVDQTTLNQYNNYKKILDENLEAIPEAKDLLDKIKRLESVPEGELTEEELERIEVYKQDGYSEGAYTKAAGMIPVQRQELISELYKELDSIKEAVGEDLAVLSSYFSLTPDPNDSKAMSAKKNFNKNMEDVFRSGQTALYEAGQIVNAQIGGKTFGKLTDNDNKKISALVHSAETGSMEMTTATGFGPDGKPGFKLSFIPTQEYNLDDNWFTSGDKIKPGERITLEFSYDTTKNPAIDENGFVNNVNGQLLQYLMTNHGEQGKQLAQAMILNNARQKYSDQTWQELEDQGLLADRPDQEMNPLKTGLIYTISKELKRMGVDLTSNTITYFDKGLNKTITREFTPEEFEEVKRKIYSRGVTL